MGVKGFRDPYTRGVPVGYEEHIVMYSLSFSEFLLNSGIDNKVLGYIKDCLRKDSKMN